ncbi:unnamed protein product [Symbiodinium necroappetens]|uniref:Uncharacterized protein n=1 Tax=Symbiodinium necroappetens TaxID=1628268 RepID=A0A812M6J8_9DINO|nr:unnamed protein product [Symbiodinium necroappetens]
MGALTPAPRSKFIVRACVGAAKEAARGHTSRASKEGCANFEGLYQDSGGGVVEVSQTKCNIRARNAAQRWSMDANADGIQVFMWDVVGTLRDGFISWSNQATWVILQDAAEAEKKGLPFLPRRFHAVCGP